MLERRRPAPAALLAVALLALAISFAAPGSAAADNIAFGGTGSGPGQFNRPEGIGVDPGGDVYVADQGNQRIQKFDAGGRLLLTIDVPANDVAGDASGNIYVAGGDSKVRKLSPQGTLLTEWSTAYPTGIAVTPGGDVVLASTDNGGGTAVRRYSPEGALLSQWGNLHYADGVAVDAHGNVYTCEAGGAGGPRIQRFSPDGTLQLTLMGGPSAPFQQPSGVTVDADRNIYVLEIGRLHKFAADGRHLASYGTTGAGVGQFDRASDVAVDARSGTVWVSETRDSYGTAGNNRVQGIDTRAPSAVVAGPGHPVLTGQPVTFDASRSAVPLSSIDNFAWDLDGDGSFETDTGTAPTATRTYAGRGVVTVAVRVRSAAGGTAVTRTDLDVRPAPPDGQVGVSINRGAQFTNNPRVTLKVVWPAFARSLAVANDGGFAAAATSLVAQDIDWDLDSSGPERLPKTVYLRFDHTGTQTYQDDIILDEVAPTLTAATASAQAAARAATGPSTRTVRLIARDDNSGLAQAQFATGVAHPAAPVPYTATTTVPAALRYVRVRDRAANWSPWHAIRTNAVSLRSAVVRRGRALVLRFTAARNGSLTVGISRSRVRVASRTFDISAGTSSVRIPTARLRRGRYVARVRLAGQTRDLRFRIR